MSEIEARLARRLAIAFWKGERAERIEVALFDAAPKLRPPQAGYQWEQADPLTTFDLKRFNAVRGYQAQQGREISRCLKELRRYARTRWRKARTNPRNCGRSLYKTNPGARQPPANDDAPAPAESAVPAAQEPSRTEPCLVGLWHGGGAPPLCRGVERGVGDRNEPRARARGSA